MDTPRNFLVRLRPRRESNYVGQGRTVLATGRNGFVEPVKDQGLFVYETRLLSLYEYRIDGVAPVPVALSNVEQHTWMGYYILLPPGFEASETDQGSGQVAAMSQNSLELRLSRYVSGGVHEDVDLTNFTQRPTALFHLELQVDADFAAIDEAISGHRQQRGQKTCKWNSENSGLGTFYFDYVAEHEYDHQGERGTASFRSGIEVRVARADSPPELQDNQLSFPVQLAPGASWHACIFPAALRSG